MVDHASVFVNTDEEDVCEGAYAAGEEPQDGYFFTFS